MAPKVITWLWAAAAAVLTLSAGFVLVVWQRPTAPSLVLPPEVHGKAGRPVALRATSTGSVVRWHCCGDADLYAIDSHNVLLWGPAPGRYRVMAWTAAHDVPSDPAFCDLVIDGPAPGPTPPPPGPTPAPGGKLHVTVFMDVAHQTPAVASLIESPTLRKAITDAGHQFRVFDMASGVSGPFGPFITKAGGAPALVIQTADGKVQSAVELPGDEASILAEVHKISP
jgi:hypothetical protein